MNERGINLVRLELREGGELYIDPVEVRSVSDYAGEGAVLASGPSHYRIKGSAAEVYAALRGEQRSRTAEEELSDGD